MGKLLGILNRRNNTFSFNHDNSEKEIKYKNIFLSCEGKNKFGADSLFYEDNNYIIATNGVILNSHQLINSNSASGLKDYIVNSYTKNGNFFFKEFKGSFNGFLYDKKKEKAIVFTSHFGDKQMFYFQNNDVIIFGSDVKEITKFAVQYSLSEKGAYSLLTYGFMLDDLTLIDEIKKLRAGHMFIIEKGILTVHKYWDFDNTIFTKEKHEEIIEHLDILFREAVRLEFEKDLEYNYEHLATLSAGLDSRMNVVVANEMGYRNQTNFTFSKSGYLDNTIAQKIASDLNHTFLFSSLTSQNFFHNFEEISKINFGNCSISGNIHGFNSVIHFNFKKFGLFHTGQLGDVVIGTFNKTPSHQPVNKLSGSFSGFLSDFTPDLSTEYLNNEHFLMHHRGFNGALQGNLIFQQYSEVASPFMDKDFFEYCMSIPPELRFNHRIYLEWIKKKHHRAGNYVWEKIRGKPNTLSLNFKKYRIPVSNFWNLRSAFIPRLIKELNVSNPKIVNKNNMNPFQFWYNSNELLQKELTSYFEQEKYRIESYPNLLKNCIKMFYEGSFIEKSQVISLLSAIKYLWGN